ncbi:ketoacyl-ACP synthase III family protein [Embleya hyalina]|uniref:3-oxoacyl-ACP synthase n=1 Tax=Embleya hyalina TaxID=516124 RepID=A0A401Z642_9ACTN|nr:ketoacyl-ACP synthase III family protein [Embleya hyalina]GCE02299.1 hypothetical protein EHYA_10076 [Embleya hyalina]
MRFDGIHLAGIGTHLPDRVSTEDAVAAGRYPAAERESSGLLSIGDAGDLPAPDMAIRAANAALKQADHEAAEICKLFHSTVHYQGPDVWSAPHYIVRNTVDRPISAIEVRHGCLGIIESLELGANHLLADPSRTAVLLTTSDNFNTPTVDRWTVSKLFVLADGAGAIVLSTRPGFARLVATGARSIPRMEELHRGGEQMFPPGITRGEPLDLERRRTYWARQWAAGSPPPMGHLGDLVAEVVRETVAEAELTMDDITRVAHVSFAQDALRDTFLDPIGIDEARGTWEFVRRTGHAGPSDHVAGLEHLWTTGAVRTGDHVLLLGGTPGFEVACAIVRITEDAAGGR